MTPEEKLAQFANRNPEYNFVKREPGEYYLNDKYVLSGNKEFSIYPKGHTWTKVIVLPLKVSYATLESAIRESI